MLRKLRLTGSEAALILVLLLLVATVGGAATGLLKAPRLAVGNTSSTSGLVNIEQGTTTARGVYFGSDCVIYRSAAAQLKMANSMYVTGDTILGDASTDSTTIAGNTSIGTASTNTITCNGRLVLRTLATDPLDATPGNRPAGTVNEIAAYSGKVYICTNATTPAWALVGPV